MSMKFHDQDKFEEFIIKEKFNLCIFIQRIILFGFKAPDLHASYFHLNESMLNYNSLNYVLDSCLL